MWNENVGEQNCVMNCYGDNVKKALINYCNDHVKLLWKKSHENASAEYWKCNDQIVDVC